MGDGGDFTVGSGRRVSLRPPPPPPPGVRAVRAARAAARPAARRPPRRTAPDLRPPRVGAASQPFDSVQTPVVPERKSFDRGPRAALAGLRPPAEPGAKRAARRPTYARGAGTRRRSPGAGAARSACAPQRAPWRGAARWCPGVPGVRAGGRRHAARAATPLRRRARRRVRRPSPTAPCRRRRRRRRRTPPNPTPTPRPIHTHPSRHSILDDLGEEITGIATPVSICMVLVVLLVRVLNPEGASDTAAVFIASLAYSEQARGAGMREWGAIAASLGGGACRGAASWQGPAAARPARR
jgi:hypothetical protein